MASAIDFANAIGLDNPAHYSGIVSIGLVIGYIVSIFLLQVMRQKQALILFTFIAIAASLCLIYLPAQQAHIQPGGAGLHPLAHVGGYLGRWPIDKLGKFTKAGSSILVMAIVGGAIFPLIFGFILDAIKTPGMAITAENFKPATGCSSPATSTSSFYATLGHKIGLKKAG